MLHSFYKNSKDQLLYRWLEKDLKKFLSLVESKSVKKAVENNQLIAEKEENVPDSSFLDRGKSAVWNYAATFMEQCYREGNPPVLQPTIQEQAEYIADELTVTFTAALEEDEFQPLSKLFPVGLKLEKESRHESEKNGETSDWAFIFATLKRIAGQYSLEESIELLKQERALQVMMKALINEYFTFIKKRMFQPKEKHYILLVWNLLYQACQDIKKFSVKYEIDFSHDGEIRCLYNMLNLYLHHFAIHGSVPCRLKKRELYFAAAALHPVEDDYMDETTPSKEVIDAIDRKIKGHPTGSIDKNIEAIFNLIDVIHQAYPVHENPLLVSIFSHLHTYQCLSEEQKKPEIQNEKLLHISFMKGGYAFAFFGSIVHGELAVSQFNHFFQMGAIFQILDDFHDLEDDLQSGSTTVWTQAVREKRTLDRILHATISLQDYYENNTDLVREFDYPVLMRRIELFGIRYDTFRFFAMNEHYFSKGYAAEFENSFPFSLSGLKKVYRSSRPYETTETMLTVLEEGRKLFGKERS